MPDSDAHTRPHQNSGTTSGGSSDSTGPLFRPGENCCAVAEARRLAMLVDGEAYFETFAAAAEAARHSILVMAWDFDSRAPLYRGSAAEESRLQRLRRRVRERVRRDAGPKGTERLGEFLNRLARRNRGLQIRVLIWDYPMIFGLDREFPPLYGLGWRPHRRVHVRYDNTHPTGASHHQKIVVIDDRIAFCGGLDLTARRWDTCRHRVHEPRRVANDEPYPPFHDVMMAVDGEAAHKLGELARERWHRATGLKLRAPATEQDQPQRRRRRRQRQGEDPWPESLQAQMGNVAVAIARTEPQTGSRPAVREVEQLYLDMIASAHRCIYIENQYFTAHRVGEALARRLQEPDGPEVVVILRLLSHGWLESISMEVLRARLLRRLQAADAHGRFHFYYPSVGDLPSGQCIDIHTKLMIVDDEMLRIGSANLANRSMGLDTECDLAVTAGGRREVAEVIAACRNRLLAEHLGVTPETVANAYQRLGSAGASIDELRRAPPLDPDQRTLQTFERLPEQFEALPGIADLADPEQPVALGRLVGQFAPTDLPHKQGPAWGRLAIIALLILALATAWRWTPLAQFATPERISHWAREFAAAPWAPFAVVLAYTPACVTMFPRPLITLFAVIAFGPLIGFTLGMTGNMLAGWLSYLAGERINPQTVRRLAGHNFSRISAVLRQRGVLAVTAVRLVPLAPYAIPGMVAGAARVRPWHYLAGTFLGLLPGGLATTVFGEALQESLQDPAGVNYWIVGGVLVVLTAATWWVRRWLLTTRVREDGHKDARRGS